MTDTSTVASVPFRMLTDLEEGIRAVRSLARAVYLMGGELAEPDDSAIQQVALEIREHAERLDAVHGKLFRLCHPDRERFERDGWPDDDAAQGEERS